MWLQLRRSVGKGCPLRGSISARKDLAGEADMHGLSAVSSAEQRYIKAPVSDGPEKALSAGAGLPQR